MHTKPPSCGAARPIVGQYGADESVGLRANAALSDDLGQLAGAYWPVEDPYGALELMAQAERERFVAVDNPDAMIDLRTYFGRARVACGAAALALGSDLEQHRLLLYAPVATLEMQISVGLAHDWGY
jgi:hypothetical protein